MVLSFVKSVLVDPEAQVLLTLAVGALICVKPVVWAPEAGFVASLDVGVLII